MTTSAARASGLSISICKMPTDGYGDRHRALGEGGIRWHAVFRALGELGVKPRLILELRDKEGARGDERSL